MDIIISYLYLKIKEVEVGAKIIFLIKKRKLFRKVEKINEI